MKNFCGKFVIITVKFGMRDVTLPWYLGIDGLHNIYIILQVFLEYTFRDIGKLNIFNKYQL